MLITTANGNEHATPASTGHPKRFFFFLSHIGTMRVVKGPAAVPSLFLPASENESVSSPRTSKQDSPPPAHTQERWRLPVLHAHTCVRPRCMETHSANEVG